jgi:hypothetical protein
MVWTEWWATAQPIKKIAAKIKKIPSAGTSQTAAGVDSLAGGNGGNEPRGSR